MEMTLRDLAEGVADERWSATFPLEKDAAKAVDIGPMVDVLFTANLFRGSVDHGPQKLANLRERRYARTPFACGLSRSIVQSGPVPGYSPVGYKDNVVSIEKQVLWLEISMNDRVP